MKELNQKLAVVQTELKAKKSSYNSFGKYYFRKSEDILEAIKPFLVKHGVTVTINEEMISTDPVPTMQSTATFSDGKDAIHATALVGVDLNQKGMQTAQQFGAASTYGKKYALGNLLLIDDTADSDATNTHDKPTARQTLKAQVNALEDKIIASKKPVIDMKNIDQAKKFIANGGLMKTLQEKYSITAEALTELNG